MKYLTFIGLILIGCNFPGLDVTYTDLFNQHQQELNQPPDTCVTYSEHDKPFISAFVEFDAAPTDLVFMTGNNVPINLSDWYDNVAVYWIDKHLSIVVEDIDSDPFATSKLYIRDGFNIKHKITFSPYTIYFGSSLTYTDYIKSLEIYRSAKVIIFYGTAFDSTQYDNMIEISLSDCDLGGRLYDLRHNTVSIERVQECKDHGWLQVLHN